MLPALDLVTVAPPKYNVVGRCLSTSILHADTLDLQLQMTWHMLMLIAISLNLQSWRCTNHYMQGGHVTVT